MKSCETGLEPLCALADELLCWGLPLDVIDLKMGEKPVPRTDSADIRTLLEVYTGGDLVIPLGAASGLVALGIDVANDGVESLRVLMTKLEIPKTPIVKPADGPIYILMRTEKTPSISRKFLEAGLELVANETYIVVPPKADSDRTHGWWKHFPADVEVAPIPQKLAALL